MCAKILCWWGCFKIFHWNVPYQLFLWFGGSLHVSLVLFSGMPSSSLWSASENMVIYPRYQFILTTKVPRGSKGWSCIPLITANSIRKLHLNYLRERRLLLLGTKNQLLTWLSSAPRLIKVTRALLQNTPHAYVYIENWKLLSLVEPANITFSM